ARYALEGSVHAAGAALQWLAAASGVARTALPIDEALSPDTEPALFVNTADGLGSPWWRRGDRREFLPAGGSLPQRLAAVVENMVFLLRVNLEQLEELRGPARRIVVAGGLSRNAALCQRLADGLQRRIHRLDGGEATIVGMWRRVSGSNAPGPGYLTLEPDPAPALERRYSQWRRQMPPVPPGQ
ncbi:MAG: FGGY-family carbohydrate kinase, partial [Wenzhouxiangellaceae bacterium]|nr:FGGY-family carbohydrate kinase [Wenzhouxiangellaceae bacterium]